jgi:hypothetical protein
LIESGHPLALEPIPPFPGFEKPLVVAIPEELPDGNGRVQSTTQHGAKAQGRLTLHTSQDNMQRRYKELQPRWKISYRAGMNMIGSKSVAELVPNTPGNQFVYGTVELEALEPDYVALGRVRPNDGPLEQAIDLFVADQISALAKEISDRRRQDLDETQLDEVEKENRKLDEFKNRFLPDAFSTAGDGPTLGEGGGPGPVDPPPPPPPPPEYDDKIVDIEVAWPKDRVLRIGQGVSLRLAALIRPRAVGPTGKTVPRVHFKWSTSDRHVIEFGNDDSVLARGKGRASIQISVPGHTSSVDIPVEVWQVDHVLLTPRTLEIPLGTRKQIVAEVTNDEGMRATDVFLYWSHDADDQLIVRINPTGWVTGNRVGQTTISAGAGDSSAGGIWARIRAQVEVVPNEREIERGTGFPRLLLTGRDRDPETGQIRDGDPEQPALWQEVSDFRNNVWWLNLENPAALFHFSQRAERTEVWRSYHAQKVVDMVQQVHMAAEYTQLETGELPDLWAGHKAAMERIEAQIAQTMWDGLKQYVVSGEGLD